MDDQELQTRLRVLFWLIEHGWTEFGNKVPQTVQALSRVGELSDGIFDLSSVDSPVRALCNMLDMMVENLPPNLFEGVTMELPEIRLPDVTMARTSEGDFMRDLVEAANIVIRYLYIAASATPLCPLEQRERPILIGHMVRLAKFYDALTGAVAQGRGEVALLLGRPLVETAVNLKFLIKKRDDTLYEEYVKASLAFEKRLWNQIQARKQDPPLPIEDRMQRSIERLFKDSGYTLDAVSEKEIRWGENAFERAQEVGYLDVYEFSFRPSSHAIHGSWSDLLTHNVEREGESWAPDLRHTRPKPGMLEAAAAISLDAARDYLDLVVGPSASVMTKRLADLEDWMRQMAFEYERWRTQIQRPDQEAPPSPAGTPGQT